MKTMKLLLVLAIVCMAGSANAAQTQVFFENWENGISIPPWHQATTAYTMATSTSYNHTPGGTKSVKSPSGQSGPSAALDYYQTDPETCWYMDYWLYDTVGPSPATTYRAYSPVMSYDGGGVTGTILQWITAGIYHTGMDTTKYQYRVLTGVGWGNLTVSRSIGWHHFRIEACRTGAYADPTHGDVKFYCDGAEPVVITDQLILAVTNVRVGSFVNTGSYSSYYDDVEFGVGCVPEPSSLIAIACGMVSLIGLRRRRV